jgi:hypothetical protein
MNLNSIIDTPDQNPVSIPANTRTSGDISPVTKSSLSLPVKRKVICLAHEW